MAEKNMVEQPITIDDCWNRIGVWSVNKERCPELGRVMHCRNCSVYAAAGRYLLDRQVPENYVKEWTSVFARVKVEKQENINSAFVFRAGGEWLALPAKLIQEVVDMGVIHSLPHRNSTILRGVVNIRGKLELCFSIGAILGIERLEKMGKEDEKYISPPRLVVAERDGERVVFPVSEIYGSFRYAEGMLQPLPVTVSGSRAAFTRGILCVENFDVGLLDDALLYEALKRNV
ncbi:MAG: chemotaxis protein CheW [Desulfobulbaceae bacterium]|nr:chemotaxis protein CheW [Desulfobulbaceae bacterium]